MPVAFVTGGSGQVGRALAAACPGDWRFVAPPWGALDIADRAAVHRTIVPARPALVVNCAAYTGVDLAESDVELARKVNADGARYVAEAAAAAGARLVQVSTDFVFGGGDGTPFAPDAPTAPLGVYARTKLAGEVAAREATGGRAVVLRTAWVYGAERRNFVLTMLNAMATRPEVRVVSDQVGTPTWARSLADAIWRIAARPDLAGTFHWTDAGVASWYDFAVAIQEEALALGLLKLAVPVRPVLTAEYPMPARRPPFSVLDKTSTWAALGVTAPHWRHNLRLMLRELPRA